MNDANKNDSNDVNAGRMLFAALLITTIGAQLVIIVPGFVQGLVEYIGLSDQQAGYVAASEMWGTAVGAIAMTVLVSRVSWRQMILVSLIVLAVVNLLTMFLTDFVPLLGIRFFSGVAAGAIISLTYAILGLTKNSDRNFGLGIMFVLLYATVVFAVLPMLFGWFGMNGLFGLLLLFSLAGLPFVRMLADSGIQAGKVGSRAGELRTGFKILAMATMFFYFICTFSVWTYLYRIGVSAGLSEANVGSSLALSGMFGVAGAFLVVVIGSRFGRVVPLSIAFVVSAVALALLFNPATLFIFGVAVCVFNLVWNFTHPYLLGAMASFSADGSMVVSGTALQMLGTGMGPMAAAYVIGGSNNYSNVMWLGVASLFFSIVCIVPPVLAQSRQQQRQVAHVGENP